MTPLRMTFTGNLGERHRYLNGFVLDAHQQNAPLHSIPEDSAAERLVKIDLASKQRNVDYILHTLKDDDILYVSRALKSLWLFEPEHSNIINPSFLEHELFPHMRLQAVNKMRHWIHTHLRNPHRCSEFYLFYKDKDFKTAAKFLWHCSNEFILSEITKILDKITPKHLKLLSETVPKVTQVYYENLKHNETVLKYYLDNDLKFFTNAKFLLKSDPDVFFFVIENFFVNQKFPSLSSEITKFIMRNHKSRFMEKPELYAAWFLNMKTLAKCLNSEEVKELVIKLAKAEFLGSWFSYKCVEPLIKSLNTEERTVFKKLVFVDKGFGSTVREWPYPIPVPPKLKVPQIALFEDREIGPPRDIRECMMLCSARSKFANFKTLLDQLFDQYRFTSFQKTLFELRKRLRAESSPQTRQYMLLVLVSKTGGRAEHLATLIDFLSQYKNEPVHIRAAIVRSLVKRAFVWRIAPEHWDKLLEWGHGLGLDGSPPEPSCGEYPQADVSEIILKTMGTPNNAKLLKRDHQVALVGNRSESAEAACNEGLHAVIIRDLLANTRPKDAVWRAFLDKFSPLAEYSLSSDERNCIRTRLPTWLLPEAQSRPEVALNRLNFLLDTLSAYHTRFDEFPGAVEAIMATAKSDIEPAKGLLNRLYKAGVGRKMLIKEFFDMIQTDASYVNALRHDTSILENTERFEELIEKKKLKHERFLRKLALFFTEKDGLSERYRATLELQAAAMPNKILARPLALLAGSDFVTLLKAFDTAAPKTPKRQLAAALRSNAHVVRPIFDLESFEWRKAGAKAVANRVATCRQKDVERYLPEALSWCRTLRLALMLAKRANKEHEAYEVFASKRPGAALKAALKYFKRQDDLDTRIWHTVKHYIAKYDQRRCHYSITKIEFIPTVIKPEYCVLVYRAYKMSSKETALSILYKIAAMLNEVDDQFLLEDIESYLRDECTDMIIVRETRHNQSCLYLYVTIIGQYLLLSTSKEVFEERFQRIGTLFFNRVESLWKRRYEDTSLIDAVEYNLLTTFIWSLKYNKAFLDTKYVSCLTLFERVIHWMHNFLPIEKWFEKYVEVHLLMIYLKSVRYCLKQRSEIFSEEGVYMLGNVFGKFIVNEVEDLTQKYFPSVIGFYEKKLRDFLAPYYFRCREFDHSIENFSKALLKGLLSASESAPAYILANSIYKGFRKCKYDDIDEIIRSYQKSENKEIRFHARVEELAGTVHTSSFVVMDEQTRASAESSSTREPCLSPRRKRRKITRPSAEREIITPLSPINLSGNLGERHRKLNTLVLEAHQQNAPLHTIPGDSAIERLVRIDLASKQRNVDYILHTLKDDDMLYVSRALNNKCLFESEHSSIINPSFLEHELFPHMRLQAVNKMKHWIHMHLRDPHRCSEFYLFYKDRDFNTAAKFLRHSSSEYVLCEITNVLDKITPKHLKLLSERVPKVTQVYYENLKHNQTVLKYYLDNDLKFFANAKFLLKSDPDVFFFVIENFFVNKKFSLFSSKITKLIIKHHKNRFMAKPELYAAWFLNIKTLTKYLTSEEVKNLVIKLARAEFLGSWFSYKRVEPLMKSLNTEERKAFKKLVFVDKAFGPSAKEWPYSIPVPPKVIVPQAALFLDPEPPRTDDDDVLFCDDTGSDGINQPTKTPLDRLFDQYRFTSFKKSLIELCKRLRVEGSPQNRQYMLLVLVSKTGGQAENLATLIELLSQYKNEAVPIRAAIVRSLVKRAYVWRLPSEQWSKFLEWGNGLGLNGGLCETTCTEGLHAVVIRDLLANITPKEVVWRAFLNKFSPLTQYSLSSDERNCIRTRLPAWLLDEAQSHHEVALNRLNFLLDTLSAHHIRLDAFPGTVEAIMAAVKSDNASAKGLLSRLYKAGVARKMLIRENFEMIQTDASYVNALRHDVSILEDTESFEKLIGKKKIEHEKFFRKLVIYFAEKNGLCERYRAVLEIQAGAMPDKILARPLALLAHPTTPPLYNVFDATPSKTPRRLLAAALRSNAHVVRPPLDLESFGWCKVGAKAVANHVATCRQKDVERYLAETLSWSRTLRLSLMLAKRAKKEHEAYAVSVSKRPRAALKAVITYFRREGENFDPRIWDTVKPHIAKLDERKCIYLITKLKFIPAIIKSEFCVLVYKACKAYSNDTPLWILRQIVALLHELDGQFIIEETEGFYRNICTEEMFLKRCENETWEDECHRRYAYLYGEMVAKYLLLSTSEEMFDERFQRIGLPYFKRVEFLWVRFGNDSTSIERMKSILFDSFVQSLKYNKPVFDTKYVACLTLFERTTEWMRRFLPIERWFGQHVQVNLMLIFLKSARACLKQNPEVFSNESSKLNEGVFLLGTTFGKYICDDAEQLTRKYFPSVIEIYKSELDMFLRQYFYSRIDLSIYNFIKALLNEILSAKGSVSSYALAEYVFKAYKAYIIGPMDWINDSLKPLQKSENKELCFRSRVDADT